MASWLETPEAVAVIRRAAQAVLFDVACKGLVPPGQPPEYARDREQTDLEEEISQELRLLLVERADILGKILSIPGRGAAAFLRTVLINEWRSRARTPSRDPVRYLQKRAGDLLRKAGRIPPLPSGPRGTCFSFGEGSVPIPPLADEDLRAIPFPDDQIRDRTWEGIRRGKAILLLAEHFWRGVSGLWKDPAVRVDVCDLVRWIAMHVPLAQPGETVPLSEHTIAEDFPGIRFDPERVKAWARQCARILGPKEARAFLLYENEDRGPSEIARRLGYRSASGAKYAVERAMKTMKGFMRDLPWVSPDDLDEEAFALFRDEIIHSLKSRLRDP